MPARIRFVIIPRDGVNPCCGVGRLPPQACAHRVRVCVRVGVQSDLRELMRKAQAERAPRVDHPLAQYLPNGKLVCRVCAIAIANAATWPSHLASAAHVQVCVWPGGHCPTDAMGRAPARRSLIAECASVRG